MAKGRKPIPDQVKMLRGTNQPCRMNGEAIVVDKISDINEITSTENLKLLPSKRSREIFMNKANQLIALGILTEMDLEMLAVYANSLDVLFSCLKKMRLPAIEKKDKLGNVVGYVPRPEVAMYKQMVDHVNRIGSEFGFTPISRQRINTPEAEGKTPYDELARLLG